MDVKIQDSELRIMNILWNEGDKTAKELSEILGQEVGWNSNTTYTLIKRLIAKGAIERREPKFICHPILSKKKNQKAETEQFIQKLYDGSADMLFAALLSDHKISDQQIEELKRYIAERS